MMQGWASLFATPPKHFMVGSDIVGGFRNDLAAIRAYDKFHGNLFRVLRWGRRVQDANLGDR